MPAAIPPANATIVTRMLFVKISLEKAACSSVVSPRSVPRSRGSVTDRYSPGTTPLAAPGSRTAQIAASTHGPKSSNAATSNRRGRSRTRCQ